MRIEIIKDWETQRYDYDKPSTVMWMKGTCKGQGILCLKKQKGEYLGEKKECQKERVAGLC